MTFPAAIVHAFYYARCIHTDACIDFFARRVHCDEFEYRTFAAASYYVLCLLSAETPFCVYSSSLFLFYNLLSLFLTLYISLFLPLSLFHLSASEISGGIFRQRVNIRVSVS